MNATEPASASNNNMMSLRLSTRSPSQPAAKRDGTPINAETPSSVLPASVLQPRSTSRITKCTDTPSVTMCRNAMATERTRTPADAALL